MMRLELRDTQEQPLFFMEDDTKTLDDYKAVDNYTIHVHYTGPNTLGEFDDVSRVEKYTISEDDYNKRDDSFRKFKQTMQAQNPNFMKPNGDSAYEDFQKEEAEALTLGTRCEVTLGSRRGEVKFVGKIKGMGAGYWVGVLLDDPEGDSDGKVLGKVLFECPAPKFGIFVRPCDAKYGDYPPIDDFDELEDEIWSGI
jgi:tubulin-specific chaperone B